jgi:hypothetical protein
MTDEIKNHWLVHEPVAESPLSLRALEPAGSQLSLFPRNRTFHPSDFNSIEGLKQAFESEALALNEAGYNVYVVMNRIRSNFDRHEAVKDVDVTQRTTLLIDIDRIGDTSRPATDTEVDAAFQLADQIEDYLQGKGFPKPWRVHSGNGCHLYYRISPVPNSEEVKNNIERFLKVLAVKFNNGLVGVDTSVFNASRITKVIGTFARKGAESADRPYRMARLV